MLDRPDARLMTDADQKPTDKMRGAVRVLHDTLTQLSADAVPSPAAPGDEKTARLGDLLSRLDERAFGFLLLLFALPCCIPLLWGIPQIVALPMLALAAQMAAGGRHPWLPEKLRQRTFSISSFQNVLTRAEKYVGWMERFATPRIRAVTSPLATRIVGALLLVPIASILTPLPGTNTAPGIGVAIAALGLIERDGILVILGLLIGFVWVFLLLFLGHEAISLIRAQLSGM